MVENNNNDLKGEVPRAPKEEQGVIPFMKRNSHFFNEVAKEGNVKIFGLDLSGKEFVENALENYNKQQGKYLHLQKSREKESNALDTFQEAVTSVLTTIKPEIDGNILRFDFQEISGINTEFNIIKIQPQ